MADTIRLNKVLRELNISIDRVADFLESKGHTIEKRPTTKISKDLYGLLCEEFQIDADKKIASKEVVEAKNKEKEEIREKQEKEQETIIKPQSEIIKASSKVVQFKKLGKIDLEPKKESKNIETTEQNNVQPKEQEIQKSSPDNNESVKKDNYKKLSGLKSTGEKN
jgi:translation initiation factor IF-2